MLYMTAKLHPELYDIEQFRADAQEFYRTFYGFEMDASGIE
jgi:iron complex transport system substrate-binding protein